MLKYDFIDTFQNQTLYYKLEPKSLKINIRIFIVGLFSNMIQKSADWSSKWNEEPEDSLLFHLMRGCK